MKHIPNILSTIRLFAIPVFVYAYFNLSPYVAAVIYVAAWLTDALDGYLARRFNWITDIGKLLDPLADKLMQITAAVCFTIDNLLFLVVLVPLLIKELNPEYRLYLRKLRYIPAWDLNLYAVKG